MNGRAAAASDRVVRGDVVELEPFEARAPAAPAEAIPLMVVYEDDDLMVIDKPAGMVVHPGAGHHSGTLVNALLCPGGAWATAGRRRHP